MRARSWVALTCAVGLVAVGVLDDDEATDGTAAATCDTDRNVLAVTTGDAFPEVWIFEGDEGHALVPGQVTAAASFSPDGSEVVTVRAEGDYDSAGPESTELWVVPTAGGGHRVLAGSDRIIASPDWSPDGTTIIYTDGPGGTWRELRSIPATGGEPTTLLALDELEVRDPAWSPDGGSIVYVTNEGDIGVVGRDGQHARTVARTGYVPFGISVDWSPDGEHLLVGVETSMEAGSLILVDVRRGTTNVLSEEASYPTWASDGTVFHFQRSGDEWRPARSTVEGDGDDAELVFDRFLDEVSGAEGNEGVVPYVPADTHCSD